MKFAQYLESNCTQEWKRAYIDYKRLKKAIKAVAIARAEREGQDVGSLPTKSPRSTRNDSFKGASAAAQRARVSEEASAGGDGRREHERNPDSSDADNDADEDSDDSDRIDQGPSAGHRHPDSPGFRQKVFKRSPSTRSGLRTDSLAPPRSNPGSPYLRSPRSPALSETPRPHYAAHTPSSRPRRDPSTPPELRLPDASALAGGSNQSNRRVAIGESTIISPDSSMDEHTVESASASERPSEDQAGQLNGSASPLPLLNGQELSGIPELHATPSTIRQGQNARSGTPSTRGSHSLKSPKIQAAIVSLRKATLGGTDPPASERLTAGAESPGSKKDPWGVRFPRDLDELRDCLYPKELDFFDLLDRQYDKVDDFYGARFSDAQKRCKELRNQLDELAEHRRIYHEALEGENRHQGPISLLPQGLSRTVGKRISEMTALVPEAILHRELQAGVPSASGDHRDRSHSRAGKGGHHEDSGIDSPGLPASRIAQAERQSELTPELYQRYKRKLRAAVTEYYKELETLKNYRILNMTGFKKALKKFEKTAKMHCLDLYMSSKIAKGSFADGDPLENLIREIEEIFTARFENGNHKKAVNKLRGQFSPTSHHFSVFRSGWLIGLGSTGLVYGLVRSFNPAVRAALPQWNALLLVYSVYLIPTLFALLFELNLAAFVAARINYTFIMEIDPRTAIDYRQFMEIPALLLVALAYCFCFSIEKVGNPFAWPMVWLGFVIAFFLNPMPMYHRHARYWLLRILGRVFTPGLSRVEFVAFFLADELNSLVYSISNIWFIGCTYNKGWALHADMFSVCSAGGKWVYSVLLVIPALIRTIQCLKRYKDTRLPIHLVNTGKYTSVMLQYAFYANWRAKELSTSGYSFPVWIAFAAVSSVYTSGWDLLVDWGLLRPQHGFLRESLGFPAYRWLYYVAMITNVILRFAWVGYLPRAGIDFRLRNFIFAMLEMLRRWQWNFFRVETEQVGNTDQYRISKDVPLPYRFEGSESDNDLAKQRSMNNMKMSMLAVGKLKNMRQRLHKKRAGEQEGNVARNGQPPLYV